MFTGEKYVQEWVSGECDWVNMWKCGSETQPRQKKIRPDTGHVTLVLETAAVETERPDCRAKTNLKMKTITNNEISKIHSVKNRQF